MTKQWAQWVDIVQMNYEFVFTKAALIFFIDFIANKQYFANKQYLIDWFRTSDFWWPAPFTHCRQILWKSAESMQRQC